MIHTKIPSEYLPFLIPLVVIQVLLAVISVIDICRQKQFKVGNRWLWILISCLINIIGPVLYFSVGRENK